MGRELLMAWRALARSPGMTALAALSIALGIGLTTAVFSVADAMLLRPFPLERPGEVFYAVSRGDDGREIGYGWPDFEDATRAGLTGAAAYQRRSTMLAGAEESENVLTHIATPNYFALLGVRAAVGRASLEEVEGRPAAVLGHGLWRRRFGGDPRIAGRTVVLDGKAFLVAGVMPAEFTGLVRGVATDLWIGTEAWFNVLGRRDERQERGGQFEIIARLKPGAAPERAAAQLDAAIRGAGKHRPAPAGSLGTILEARFAPGWKTSLTVGGGLLMALGLVLFVACANVAQLRLAQAESRNRELAMRIALGAGPWRVTRHLLIETGILAVAGAAMGVLLAGELARKTAEFLAAGRPYIDYGIGLDGRALAFTLAATVFAVLVAGLAPLARCCASTSWRC